ncbi:MAG TPA: long-chain-fatty-acid--CoA ligase [Oculatellaceae cyanobacterium]
MTFNLHLSLTKALSLWPDREAVIDGDKRFTYAALGKRIGRLAQHFLSIGLQRDSVVAILAPNCHEYMETYYACASVGIVLNPLNFRLAAREIGDILRDSHAVCLIVHEDFANCAESVLQQETNLKHVITIAKSFKSLDECAQAQPKSSEVAGLAGQLTSSAEGSATYSITDFESSLANANSDAIPFQSCNGDQLAQLYYTSGTTGKAKGVMLNHTNVTTNALGAITELQFSDSTVWGHFAPIFHLADAWAIFAVSWVGGKHVFVPYFKALDVLNAMSRERVSTTALVPTMVNQLLACPQLKQFDLSSLNMLMTAGSPVAPEQVKRIMKELNCDYLQFYGLTETSPFLTVGAIKEHLKKLPEDRLLSLKARTGRAFISTQIKVVRPDGTEVEWNGEEVGEIIARGPNVTKGYWNQPETTAAAIRDGWFYTGDLSTIDQEGYLNIVDRSKDMIISGGENVYSTEVEYCIYEHPAVLECAVFGIPDEKWGELVKAVIVLKNGHSATPEELTAHVRQRLANYKIPRSIDIVQELPKTGSGKIFKKGLRDKYWQSGGRQVN